MISRAVGLVPCHFGHTTVSKAAMPFGRCFKTLPCQLAVVFQRIKRCKSPQKVSDDLQVQQKKVCAVRLESYILDLYIYIYIYI